VEKRESVVASAQNNLSANIGPEKAVIQQVILWWQQFSWQVYWASGRDDGNKCPL